MIRQVDTFNNFNQSIFSEKKNVSELSMKMASHDHINYHELSEESKSTNNYSLSPTNTRATTLEKQQSIIVKEELVSPLTPSPTPTPNHTPILETEPKNEIAPTQKKGPLDFVNQDEEDELKFIAQKLYDQDFISIKVEEYTQYLASTERENQMVRALYMDLFQWDPSLLKSIRKLCDKLYFKGESQEIDRILKAFSISYVKQHSTNVFGDDDKVYILCYSLILLNTALHNKVNTKTNRDDFIRNTIRTYNDGNKKYSIKQNMLIERELTKYFDELSKSELLLKTGISNEQLFQQQNGLTRQKSYRPRLSSLTMNNQLNYTQQQQHHQDQHQQYPQIRKASAPQLLSRTSMSGSRKSSHDPDFNLYEYNHATILRKQKTNTGQLSMAPVSPTQGYNPPNYDRRGSYASTNTNNTQYTDYSELLDTIPSNEAIGFTKALMENQSPNKKNLSRSTTNNSMLRNTSSLNHLRSNGNFKNLNHFSSMNNISKNQQLGLQNADNFDQDFKLLQDKCDLELELNGPPYIKEGLMKYRVINNDQSTSKLRIRFKMENNKWEENFIVVSKGELRLYSFQEKLIKKYNKVQTKIEKSYIKQQHQQFQSQNNHYNQFQPPSFSLSGLSRKTSINSFAMQSQASFGTYQNQQEQDEVGDGNWLKNALNLGNYNLCSTFSEIIDTPPPGTVISSSANSNSCYWVLTFPKTKNLPPKQFLFEAGTKEIATEFVNSCNFWASRISAIPTEEPISSIEYGWSEKLLRNPPDFRKCKIQKWSKTPGGVYLTHLAVYDQFIKLIEYFQSLERNLNEHIIIKAKILETFKKFRYTSNYKNALINYETKLNYLKSEANKYKNYLIILAYGLQLRFELNDKKVKKQIRLNLNDEEPQNIDDIDDIDEDFGEYEDLSVDPVKVQLIKSQIKDVVNLLTNGKNLVFKTTGDHQNEVPLKSALKGQNHDANTVPVLQKNNGIRQNSVTTSHSKNQNDRSNSVATVTTNLNYNRSNSVVTITTHNLSKLNSINRVSTNNTTNNSTVPPSPNLSTYLQYQQSLINQQATMNEPSNSNTNSATSKNHEVIEEEEFTNKCALSKLSTNDSSKYSDHDATTTISTSNNTNYSLNDNQGNYLQEAVNELQEQNQHHSHTLIQDLSSKIDEVDEDDEIDLTFEHTNPGRLVIV